MTRREVRWEVSKRKDDRHFVSLAYAFIAVALVIFWVGVCFGPPAFRKILLDVFGSFNG